MYIFLKGFNSNFSYIEVSSTDPNFKPQDKHDEKNMGLVTKWYVTYKIWCVTQLNLDIKYFWKDMDFCLLVRNG